MSKQDPLFVAGGIGAGVMSTALGAGLGTIAGALIKREPIVGTKDHPSNIKLNLGTAVGALAGGFLAWKVFTK